MKTQTFRMTSARVRQCAGRLALALMLIFAQQQAIQHSLSHGFEQLDSRRDDGSPSHHGFCEHCLSFADFEHTVASAPPVLPQLVSETHVDDAPAPIAFAPPLRSSYQSRAPPQLS